MDEDRLKNSTAAHAHLGQQVRVRAELVGREQPDVEPAAGRLADAVERLLGADIDRVGRVLPGCQLEVELGRRSAARDDAAQRQRGTAGQQGPAGDSPFSGVAGGHSFPPCVCSLQIVAVVQRHFDLTGTSLFKMELCFQGSLDLTGAAPPFSAV